MCRQADQEPLLHESLELDVTDTGRQPAHGRREVVPLWAGGTQAEFLRS